MKKLRDIGRCVGSVSKADKIKDLEELNEYNRQWIDIYFNDAQRLRLETKTLKAKIRGLESNSKSRTTIPIHDFSKYRIIDQIEKVQEEYFELEASYREKESIERTIEEATDLIQATFNLIEMLSPGKVHEALQKHSEKMKERGYKVKYELEVLNNG